jgi:ABC-type antimicrobial peptide transport system permease subunit
MIVRQAVVLIGAGVASGVAAAIALGSVMRSLLFQVSERDPVTVVAIAVLLAGVGLIASIVPAYRAARVDPLVALRAE